MKLVHSYLQFVLVLGLAVGLAAPAAAAAAAASPEQARLADGQVSRPLAASQPADAPDPANGDSVSWTMASWYSFD